MDLRVILIATSALTASLTAFIVAILYSNEDKVSPIGKITLTDALNKIYQEKLKPLEDASLYKIFAAPMLDVDFDTKPTVLLLGQYSTGKTSFINYLIGEEYPDAEVGPEPTTDKFVLVKYSKRTQVIDGKTLVSHDKSPFRELANFEAGFLKNFKSSELPNSILELIMFIDTPGVLSGKKQRDQRNYDFLKALKWFADRSDRILLFFDPNKLVISDEMKSCMETVINYDDKIRFILNKASSLDMEELLGVIGELQGNLGKIIKKPEIPQILVTSFKKGTEDKLGKFTKDQEKILKDLAELPNNSAQKKLSAFNHRVRQVLLHSYVMHTIKKDMPWYFEIESYLKQNIAWNLENIVAKIKENYPFVRDCKYDLKILKDRLLELDWASVKFDKQLIDNTNSILEKDMGNLLDLLENEISKSVTFKNDWPKKKFN